VGDPLAFIGCGEPRQGATAALFSDFRSLAAPVRHGAWSWLPRLTASTLLTEIVLFVIDPSFSNITNGRHTAMFYGHVIDFWVDPLRREFMVYLGAPASSLQPTAESNGVLGFACCSSRVSCQQLSQGHCHLSLLNVDLVAEGLFRTRCLFGLALRSDLRANA
jgi:hypothetical protein